MSYQKVEINENDFSHKKMFDFVENKLQHIDAVFELDESTYTSNNKPTNLFERKVTLPLSSLKQIMKLLGKEYSFSAYYITLTITKEEVKLIKEKTESIIYDLNYRKLLKKIDGFHINNFTSSSNTDIKLSKDSMETIFAFNNYSKNDKIELMIFKEKRQ